MLKIVKRGIRLSPMPSAEETVRYPNEKVKGRRIAKLLKIAEIVRNGVIGLAPCHEFKLKPHVIFIGRCLLMRHCSTQLRRTPCWT